MYGNLQEISISNILQLIESGQRSGVLFLETPSLGRQENQIFIIFCYFGKITYAADHNSFSLGRIYDFLRHYKLENIVTELSQELLASNNIPEYEAILLLGQKQIISNYQSQKILQSIIQETLFNILLLSKGHFTWQENYTLQPQIMRLTISQILPKLNIQKHLWLQCYPYIKFSNQYPVIKDEAKLKATLTENTYSSFCQWIDGKTSLIELSRYLNKDLITIAKAIYPWVEMGWVKLLDQENHLSSDRKNTVEKNKVIYLTKDLHLTASLKILFKQTKYELLILNDLGEGLTMIFDKLPNLILLEMNDFNFNSDYFCKIIRNNQQLINTPIIVITNHYQFLENLKHKIAGATEYITKSVITKDFFNVIKKYL